MKKYILGFLFVVAWVAVGCAADVTIRFTWTAVDDGEGGVCASYDMRYVYTDSTTLMNEWHNAVHVSGEPTPQVLGTAESMTKTFSLTEGETYYFAMKVFDSLGVSSMSNIVGYAVPAQNMPPGIIQLNLEVLP